MKNKLKLESFIYRCINCGRGFETQNKVKPTQCPWCGHLVLKNEISLLNSKEINK